MRILELLNRRVGSARDIADELGATPAAVGYHVRVLRDCGTIELVRTERRGGAVRHFYRGTARIELDDDEWARAPPATRRTFLSVALEKIAADVGAARTGGGFDRDDVHVSVTGFDLDEQGYRELRDLLTETFEWAMAIQAEVIGRRVGDSDAAARDEIRTELVMLHFLRPDGRG